jgi:hypothetical protein
MIILPIACILFGCLQDVPVVVTDNPIRYHLEQALPKRKGEVKASCYVEGVFYTECPSIMKYKP